MTKNYNFINLNIILNKGKQQHISLKNQLFLSQIEQHIYKHLADEQFNAAALASKMCLSPSQLNRILNATTNFTVGLLIREFRISYAATLLLKDVHTIGEVAAQVGYFNHANFSRSFKQRFGCSPKDYLKQKYNMLENDKNMRKNE